MADFLLTALSYAGLVAITLVLALMLACVLSFFLTAIVFALMDIGAYIRGRWRSRG